MPCPLAAAMLIRQLMMILRCHVFFFFFFSACRCAAAFAIFISPLPLHFRRRFSRFRRRFHSFFATRDAFAEAFRRFASCRFPIRI